MRPLEDVRIVAVEQYGAGPFGSLHLAELGADVIKVEDPRAGGDVGRYVPPYQRGEDSLFFETFNRNKRSISLDLTAASGRAVLHDLVRHCDAVYSNLRGDLPAKLGLRYADLKTVNPRVVCCSLSGFGMTGPLAKEPAYDYILQGMCGWMSLTGEPGGPPAKSGFSVVDFGGGYVAALSLVAGIHAARRDGHGMDCDISLFDVALAMQTYVATWNLSAGFEPQRTAHSAHPSVVPFQIFPTADGWIVVVAAKEKFFVRLCEALERPELANDERFRGFDARRRNRTELVAILEPLFAVQATAPMVARLRAVGVPCGPVNSVAEALAEPQTAAREMIVAYEHPEFGTVRSVASPVRVGASAATHRRAPRRGEDRDAILRDLLNYSPERVATAAAAGAFGVAVTAHAGGAEGIEQ